MTQAAGRKVKTLLLDIETAPIAANVWRIWQENVGINQIIKDWHLLSFSAKWLDDSDDKIMYFDQRKRRNIEDDTILLRKLWRLLDEADIVVGHNAKRFDVKKINARLLLHGFKPPSPYRIVDTLLIAKSQFAFTSNKLEFLTDKLNVKYKKRASHGAYPGFALWKGVLAGDPKAWDEMEIYNKYDVLSLQELYLILRPWDKMHPNVTVPDESHTQHACPVCGGFHLQKRGYSFTNTGKYQRFQCECGAWSRSRYTLNSTAKRKATLSS